jgi:hypothetical protein
MARLKLGTLDGCARGTSWLLPPVCPATSRDRFVGAGCSDSLRKSRAGMNQLYFRNQGRKFHAYSVICLTRTQGRKRMTTFRLIGAAAIFFFCADSSRDGPPRNPPCPEHLLRNQGSGKSAQQILRLHRMVSVAVARRLGQLAGQCLFARPQLHTGRMRLQSAGPALRSRFQLGANDRVVLNLAGQFHRDRRKATCAEDAIVGPELNYAER